MKRTIISVALAGLLVVPMACAASRDKKAAHNKTNAASSRKTAAPQPPGDWHPAPGLAAHLGAKAQVGDYALLLPAGYNKVSLPPALTAQQKSQGFDNYAYATDKRPDGTRGGLYLTIATPPTGTTGVPSLDEALHGALAQKQRDWQGFAENKPESGRVGGLAFERVYFKGTYVGTSVTRLAHGLAYVTEDRGKIISIIAEDIEPHNEQTLPVAEAAVLTFHRQ